MRKYDKVARAVIDDARRRNWIADALYKSCNLATALVGGLVVAPFYAYEVSAHSAGNDGSLDVKRYWPFGYGGIGGAVNDIAIVLTLAAPLILPSSIVWCLLRYRGSRESRIISLVPAFFALVVLISYAADWSAIVAWHLD